MKTKFTFFLFALLFSFASALQAQDLVGAGSATFDNSNPCVISLTFQYTNAGTVDAGPFTTGVYLTTDMFFADPTFDIKVAEIVNGQGCNVNELRTVTVSNVDIDQLQGFQSGTNYFVYYFLDVEGDVNETNEGNNIASLGNTTCTLTSAASALQDLAGLEIATDPAGEWAALQLQLTETEMVSYSVLDLQGRVQAQSAPAWAASGRWRQELDLRQLEAGLYLVQVQVGEQSEVRKLLVR